MFTERIAYQTRYFIPVEKDIVRILNEIIKMSPVLRIEHKDERSAGENSVPKGKPSILETLKQNAEKSRLAFDSGVEMDKRSEISISI